jgi:hypothetical protein
MKFRSARVLAVLGVTAAALSAVQESPAGWKQYSFATDGFSVSAPSAPVKQEGSTGKVEVRNYAIELGDNSGVMISIAQIAGSENTSPKALLQGAKNGAIGAVKAKLTSEKEITFAGYPGLEIEAATDTYHMRARFLFAQPRLLSLMAIAPVGAPLPQDAPRIFDSLKVFSPQAASH